MPDTSDLRRTAESVKTRVADVGETVKAQVAGAADQVTRAAAGATDQVREQGARLAENAQEFYDDLAGDTAGDKLRSLITDYPVAALLVAGAAGYLIGRALHDR